MTSTAHASNRTRVLIRFLIAGAWNTAVLVLTYQLFLFFAPHSVAYVLGYTAGILVGYYTYSRHVFHAAMSKSRLMMFAIFYALSVLVGTAINSFFVEYLALHARLAVFATIAVMLPFNYFGTKACLGGAIEQLLGRAKPRR